VRVLGIDAPARQFDHLVAVVQVVDEVAARQVAALEQDPAFAVVRQDFAQALGRAAHVARTVGHALLEKNAGFGQVRGEHGGERQQRLAQQGDRVGGQQVVAALGDHHRVEHQMRQPAAAQAIGHGADDAGVAEHADLRRSDGDVGEQRVDLQADEVDRRQMHAGDGTGILRGERRDDAAAVGAEGRERLEVGEQAGAARRVDARNGQDVVDFAPGSRGRPGGKGRQGFNHDRFPKDGLHLR
jgi:hypothetical protein